MKPVPKIALLYALLSSALTLIIVGIVWSVYARQAPAIPPGIQKQLNFIPFVVDSTSDMSVNPASFTYDASNQTFAFTLHSKTVGELTVSEQPTPPQFIDIQDYYSKLIDTINRYSAFDNQLGTVYLTKPSTLPVGQMAVLNANGVLVFVRSSKDVSDNQWRQVFENFRLQG